MPCKKNGGRQLNWVMVIDSLPATRGLWRMIAKNNNNDLDSNISRFRCWNVKTMNGREQELVAEMEKYRLEVLGVS